MSDYETALAAAGADILAFESFGSYQGDWWAHVLFEGNEGWVHGYYGSCSGCDAFEGEFGYIDKLQMLETGPDAELLDRLAAFGRGYLDDLLTQEEAEAVAAKNIEWDMDAAHMLAFIKAS